jgi:NAD(P)-dependent dehydrogenase (short-subunit alcohol dehydrogenase family)
MSRATCIILAAILGSVPLAGCVVYEPVSGYYPGGRTSAAPGTRRWAGRRMQACKSYRRAPRRGSYAARRTELLQPQQDESVTICAASGLKDFDLLLNAAAQRSPLGELVDILDVGYTCADLATPYARRLSGETLYVDGGVNIMA